MHSKSQNALFITVINYVLFSFQAQFTMSFSTAGRHRRTTLPCRSTSSRSSSLSSEPPGHRTTITHPTLPHQPTSPTRAPSDQDYTSRSPSCRAMSTRHPGLPPTGLRQEPSTDPGSTPIRMRMNSREWKVQITGKQR